MKNGDISSQQLANTLMKEGRKPKGIVRPLLAQLVGWVFVVMLFCTTALGQSDPAQVGQWSPVMYWPFDSPIAFLLPTGKVMFSPGQPQQYLWNPQTDLFENAKKPPYFLGGGGADFLQDGTLLVAGIQKPNQCFMSAAIYDPFSDSWKNLPDMTGNRYYPTVTSLPNGEAVVISGLLALPGTTSFQVNAEPQVWEPLTGTWRYLTTGLNPLMFYYPYCFVAPNGKVFCAGPTGTSSYLDTSGTGHWTTVGRPLNNQRYYGSSVTYSPGKVLMTGGNQPPIATSEVIDLSDPSPAWRYVGSMSSPRFYMDATILPDGTVLATGGSSGIGDDSTNPVLAAETWDPTTETWTTLASATIYRGLHSFALLLPDGRVLKASGNFSPNTAEIFSPPYLFRGARPVVDSAPASATFGQEIFIGTKALDITKITLVRLGSVTHSLNMGQRINSLAFWQVQGGWTATMPANGALCPPGYYMLFVVNSSGVPSVAKFIQVRG